MSSGPGTESVREYVAVLRGIGLTERAIADLHHAAAAGSGLEAAVAESLGDVDEAELRQSLLDAVARSPRGIDAPHEYWNHAPEVHLEELLAPYGCRVSVEPARGADTLAEGELVVRLSDADGTEFWTRFEYPDSALAENNYPALLHHVEQELLAGTGLRIVRLRAPPGRWRFAAMTEAQLSALRDRYGEHVEVFGGPLLAVEQLEAFHSTVPPIPPGYEPEEEVDEEQREPALERHAADSLAEVTVGDDGPDAGEIDLGLEDPGEASPDRIVQSVRQADAGSGSTAAAAGAHEVEASDEDLESVFGDLSSVSLEPGEPDPQAETGASGGETLTIDGGTVAAGDGEDPIDDLFDEMKREVADSTPTTGTEVSAGNEASVSDLISGAAEDGADGRDAPGDRGSAPDVPQDAADLTASELFGDLDEDA